MKIPDVIVEDLGVGEGPVWCADGTVVVTSVNRGVLYRIWPEAGRKEELARTRGGPNGATPASDGGFIVAQNGGFDFNLVGVDSPQPDRVEPGLQRVMPDGQVSDLAVGGFSSPNDLVVDARGTLYFTDPPRFPFEPEDKGGRVWAVDPGQAPRLFEKDFGFCNGIGIDLDGTVLIIEDEGISRGPGEGPRSWVIESVGTNGGDGFCLDQEGRLYVCVPSDHGVRIFEDGRAVDFMEVPFPEPSAGAADSVQWVTNCCFGGPDLRTLYATTGFPGMLVAWHDMPTPGAEVQAFRV